MRTIGEAKERLEKRYCAEKGFVGIGIGRTTKSEALRVYVEDAESALAQKLKSDVTYEGYPVIVEVSGKVRAFRA